MSVEDSRLTVLFEGVAAATDERRYLDALRLADSARRLAPDHPTATLVYARALLQAGEARLALAALHGREDPDSGVLTIDAAARAGFIDEAFATAERLLAGTAVDSIAGLIPAVSRLWRQHGARHPGWVGIDSQLNLVGEIRAGGLALIEQGGQSLGHVSPAGAPGVPVSFVRAAPTGAGALSVRVGSQPLLGSALPWPPDFGVSGWVVLEGSRLKGEVRMDWNARAPVTLVVSQDGQSERFEVEPTGAGRSPFALEVPAVAAARRGDVGVAALLPDGRVSELAGSPLQRIQPPAAPIAEPPPRPAKRLSKQARARLDAAPPPRVNIIVPVYSGLEDTLACLRSVLATTPATLGTLTVVDDATPDLRLRAALDELAAEGCITLLRNEANLGFPGAINRGLQVHPQRDVVLLNADTEVFEGWLERLQAAAYARDAIGTATPLGEAASIVSYQLRRSQPLSSAEAADIDRIARVVNAGKTLDIPVGVGFCLYVRRRCLEEVGEFDERGFGKGYGEENDFCLRARRRGWRHVAATGVFVRHAGARSFGRSRELLTTRNRRVINHRHPGYDELIREFVDADSLRESKRAIDERRLRGAPKPVLLLSLDLAGGVQRHVDLRQAALSAAGHTVLTLRADEDPRHPGWVVVTVVHAAGSGATGDFEHLLYELPREAQALRLLLLELRLAAIEIHHFLGLGSATLEMIAGLGVPYAVHLHDYTWICPRVSFLDSAGRYCGEPALAACEACVQQNGSALGEPLSVAQLRDRSERLLGQAARIVAPTQDVRQRFLRYFPALAIEVEPWEAPPPPAAARRRARAPDAPLKVVLMGGINTQKGHAVLLECARDAAARSLPLQFVVIGFTREDAPLIDTGRVFITGPYREEEAAALLERERADLALFPTVGPETWCYTLTHVLSHNVPVVAFDLGAVAERLRAAATGVLLPPTATAQVINDTLLRYAADSMSSHPEPAATGTLSAAGSAVGASSRGATPEVPIGASVQLLNLPVGIYAFTVTGGGATRSGELALPALQVAPAPMRSAGSIEFLCAPSTLDRWLTGSADVVTVKISGGSAALLLTSIRAPDSPVLSIDVRRLDAPGPALPAIPAAPPPLQAPVPPGSVQVPHISTLVHVPYLGDLEFLGGWAGRPAENLWIEGFAAVASTGGGSGADLIEYCAITEAGHETGWLSGGALAGNRGTGTPLVAFAVRINEAAAARYHCLYAGQFLSGNVIGPLSEGLCRSASPGDPLVAIELAVSGV